MSKLFYKYKDIFNHRKDDLFILVDNNFEIDNDSNVKYFSEMKKPYGDFVDLTSSEIMVYITFRRMYNYTGKPQDKDRYEAATYIFKKNKLYNYNGGNFLDELGNVVDDYHDIWYDPFLFAYKKDIKQIERALKINNLNEFA